MLTLDINHPRHLLTLESEAIHNVMFCCRCHLLAHGLCLMSFSLRLNSLALDVQAIAEEFAQDEADHVRFLRGLLGSDAVPMPQLNIGSAFTTAVDAAAGEQLSPAFSPYANDISFYIGAYFFEVRSCCSSADPG